MLFLSLSDLLVLLAHLLVIGVQVALVVVVGVLVTCLQLLLHLRVLIAVIVQFLAQLEDGGVQRLHALFMIFALLFANALGLLSKILFGLATLGILVGRRLFEGELVPVELCLLVLVIVLGFRELFLLLKARLFEGGGLLAEAFKHLLDIFCFFDRRFQFILPKLAHVFESFAEIGDLVLLGNVEFLVQLILHLLAGENAHQL